MNPFEYVSQHGRVVFGIGSIQKTAAELEGMNLHRAALVTTSGRSELAENVADMLGESCAGIVAEAVQHVPTEIVTKSLKLIESIGADSIIAIGGGSAIGLAKAIALKTSLPIIAIPTTYAGSEMTPIWGMTENGRKKTGKDRVVKPQTVIYDPVLTSTLPLSIAAKSGMNAIAHCVEALYSENANPITSLMAEEGIRALREGLPQVLENPEDLKIHANVLYGAWLGGTVLGSVGMALHHKLCHILGGSFNLPHAETHSVILPFAVWYNYSHAPEAMERLAKAFGTHPEHAAGTLFDLGLSLRIPMSLAEIGLKEENLDQVAEQAVQNPYYNPRPVDKKILRQLLQYAYNGDRPGAGRFDEH